MRDTKLAATSGKIMEGAKTGNAAFAEIPRDMPWPVAPYVTPALVKLAQQHGFTVKYTHEKSAGPPGTNAPAGTDFIMKVIWLVHGMSPASEAAALFHELGHVLAGKPFIDKTMYILYLQGLPDPRPEIEAQLAAGTAEETLGIGENAYHEDYIANWAAWNPEVLLNPPVFLCEEAEQAARLMIGAVDAAKAEAEAAAAAK